MVYAPEVAEVAPPPVVGVLEWSGGARELGDVRTLIGRSGECDITLDDPNVSRRHAEVRRDGEGFVVVDLESTNGTEVNGKRIREAVLADGDVIGIGTTRLTFEHRSG
jgi:pSer/pThr/pTyr-binding forkhead associated (FHA) protein